MGSTKAADDYKELELYLQQAEEEIQITLSQVKSTELEPLFTNKPGHTGSHNSSIDPLFTNNSGNTGCQNSSITIQNHNLKTPAGIVDLNKLNYKNLKILSTGIDDTENCGNPLDSRTSISRNGQQDSRTCVINSSEILNHINNDSRHVNRTLQSSSSDVVLSHQKYGNKKNDILFRPEFTEILSWSCGDVVSENSGFNTVSMFQNEKKPGAYCIEKDLNGKNGIYDNLFRPIKEFVPLDDLKGQRPRYKSETCMEISVTEIPRKRSKSESYIERDSPILFITGKDSGRCNSEQKFKEDFQTPTFDLDNDNSDGSITPVFSLESFIERCSSPNLVSESCLDRSNTPVCVPENSVFERSDTPTFVPSVDKTEKIICSTLSKCKQLRRSKTDPGFDNSLKYSFRKYRRHDPLELDDIDYDFNLEEIPLRSSVSSSPGEFFHKYETDSKKVLIQPKRKLSSTGVQTSFDENCNEIWEKDDRLDLKKLLLKVSTGTNTTDSLERPKKKVKENRKMSAKENKNVTASDNKESDVTSVHSNENCDINKEIQKATQNSSHEMQSPVKKPTSFPSELVTNMSSFLNDESPEMQVIVNATSPVLFRRRSSNNFRTHGKFQVQNVDGNPPEASVPPDTNDNLFMNPDMAKTWHGITSNKWKTYYGPIMRNMLQEINNNSNNDTGSENGDINQSLQYNSNSLRARTLLDEMHKKYCAYQYKNRLQLPSPDDLILPFKLKSSPPPPNRMLSRSWIFRKYAVPTNTPSPSPTPESPDISESTAAQQTNNQPDENKDGSRELTPTDSSSKQSQPKQKLNAGKEDAEIEAVEACRWLKEAGFPQYSQMYDDGQFPVDISSVEKDHDFLDKDSMQPLVRRLSTLNKCAIMRISTPTRKNAEDSDDDDQCALSDKWKYQHNIRRWSRKDLNSPSSDGQPNSPVVKSSSSNDSLLTEQNSSSETGDSPVLETKMHHSNNTATDDFLGVKTSTPVDTGGGGTSSLALSPRLRRAASERLKGAKNFLKRVESFKSRKTRKIPRTAGNVVEISGPVVTDSANMQEKIKHLNCRDLSPSSEEPPSPLQEDDNKNLSTISVEVSVTSSEPVPEPWSDDSTNYKLPTTKLKTTPSSSVSCHALSDNSKNVESQSQSTSSRTPVVRNGVLPGSTGSTPHLPTWRDQSSSEFSDLFILPTDYKPGSFPRDLEDYDDAKCCHRINHRTGSFNLGHKVCDVNSNTVVKRRRGSMDPKLQVHRHSIYDNVPLEENLEAAQEDLDMILYNLFQDINGLNKTIYGDDAEVLSPPSSIFNTTNSKPEDADESLDADDSSNGNDQENDVISGTVSSPDSSDHDIPCEDLSHDDSGDHIVYRERRDSGVGSSLTRAPSDRRRYRIRWHSFQKSHRPSIGSRNLQITSLSVCQLMVLQKLSLCRLTGLIEKYSPNRSNWTWTVPRFMKRHKVPDYSVKNIFGVPLLVTLQRTGQPLPQCILHAMRYLRKTAGDAVGIFRKSGVRSRIQKLKNDVEENAELVNFEELQAYDVADLVKQYFRELPECLLTNKLSEIFFNIFIYVPVEYRVDALQSAIFLLPDENREVLQSLLLFLGDIATHDAEHQMTASNLAVCFAPSLFNMGGMKSATQSPSPRRPRKNLGVPDARELQEQKAAQDCLTTMIKECKQIFMIPVSLMSKCRFSYIEQGDPVSLDEFYKKSSDEQGYQTYVDNSIQGLLKESREKSRGWISTSVPSVVDVSCKKVADGHPLRLWKCCIDVEAPPEIVLDRIKNERHTWDEDMMNWRSIEKLDNQTEIFQYVRNSMAPHPSRDYCVLRCWKTDLAKGACALISTSVEHPKAELLGGIRAVELASHYLIEPCGTGKSRITHMCRLDMRGRTPEWYKKAFGHICVNSLERIRDSFKQTTDGPESTV